MMSPLRKNQYRMAFVLLWLLTSSFTIINPLVTKEHLMKSKETEQKDLLRQLKQLNRLFIASKKSAPSLQAKMGSLREKIVEYNKEYYQYSKANGLEIPNHCLAVLKAGQVAPSVSAESSEEDIDCSSFITAVLQWRTNMKKFFIKSKKSHGEVLVNVKDFKAWFSDYQSNTPIVQDVYKEWQGVLSGLEGKVRGEVLFQALLNNTGGTWSMAEDIAALEKHYKEHRKVYKKYESTMDVFQTTVMPKTQYFTDALSASVLQDDPNLPENKKKQEEEVERQQLKYEEEVKRWKVKYEDWLNKNLVNLSKIDTTEAGMVINKSLLSKFRKSDLLAPSYAKEFWQETGEAIEEGIKAEKGEVTYKKASKIAIEILKTKRAKYINRTFLEAAIASGEVDLPLGLEDWLKSCIDDNELLYKDFVRKWKKWCQGVSNVVPLCEYKMKGRTYLIDLQKLQKELGQAFSYTVNGSKSGEAIWKCLHSHLPQGKTCSFEQLNTAWKNGIEGLQDASIVRSIWEKYLTDAQESTGMEHVISNFFAKIPSQEQLVNCLWDARYRVPKAKMPVPKDTLLAFFTIEESTVKNFSFALPLPLRIHAKTLSNGELRHYAVPQLEGLSLGNLINQGGNSYMIDALNNLSCQPTEIKESEQALLATTTISFKLSVRDTMEKTTIKVAENAGFDMLNLNLDQIIGLENKVGAKLFDGKTLGIQLRLVGTEAGDIGEIQATGMIMGMAVTFHMGENGWYVRPKNPFAFKEALKQPTEGASNYDLFFSIDVVSKHIGYQHSVYTRNGQQGKVDLDGNVHRFVKRTLNITYAPDSILIPLGE